VVEQVKKIIFTAFVFAFLAAGCGQLFLLDPEEARATANEFFNALYMQQDADAAYAMTDENFAVNNGEGSLEVLYDTVKVKYGRVQGVKPDSYMIDQSTKSITLFYMCLADKGIFYNSIQLYKDAKEQYRITLVKFSAVPVGPFRTEHKFKSM
jgi:hypothetical protein